MLGALRSKQQLITSSVLNKCWLGEFTVRATQPMEVKETHSKISENYRFSQQPKRKGTEYIAVLTNTLIHKYLTYNNQDLILSFNI